MVSLDCEFWVGQAILFCKWIWGTLKKFTKTGVPQRFNFFDSILLWKLELWSEQAWLIREAKEKLKILQTSVLQCNLQSSHIYQELQQMLGCNCSLKATILGVFFVFSFICSYFSEEGLTCHKRMLGTIGCLNCVCKEPVIWKTKAENVRHSKILIKIIIGIIGCHKQSELLQAILRIQQYSVCKIGQDSQSNKSIWSRDSVKELLVLM